jgi:VanZ family protein
MTRTQTIAFRLGLFVIMGAITYLATTGSEYPVVRDISDKANHLLAFYVLALFVDFSFPEKKLGFLKISSLLTYGLLIEVIQSFLPDRTASFLDLVADGIGVALYQLSLPVLRHLPLLNRRWRTEG